MRMNGKTKIMACALAGALATGAFGLMGCSGSSTPSVSLSSSSSASSAVGSSSAATAVATDSDLTGVWELAYVTIGGEEYTVEEYEEANGLPEGSLESTYDLADDGTMVVTTLGLDVEGEWTQDGNAVTLTVLDEDGNGKDTAAVYDADSDYGEAIIASDPSTGNVSVFVRS